VFYFIKLFFILIGRELIQELIQPKTIITSYIPRIKIKRKTTRKEAIFPFIKRTTDKIKSILRKETSNSIHNRRQSDIF